MMKELANNAIINYIKKNNEFKLWSICFIAETIARREKIWIGHKRARQCIDESGYETKNVKQGRRRISDKVRDLPENELCWELNGRVEDRREWSD